MSKWLAIGLMTLAFAMSCAAAPRLTGTNLGNEQAPGFRLRDSSGQGFSLDQFRGKVVVLSFLYTHCTDYCPLTAELLRNADAAAGHPNDVVYLAISVDPAGDTAESIAKFQQDHRLDQLGSRWHYLLGDAAELSGVWRNYYIGVSRDLPPGEAGHSSALYFIDKRGYRRAVTQLDVRAEDIARNELVLARQ